MGPIRQRRSNDVIDVDHVDRRIDFDNEIEAVESKAMEIDVINNRKTNGGITEVQCTSWEELMETLDQDRRIWYAHCE